VDQGQPPLQQELNVAFTSMRMHLNLQLRVAGSAPLSTIYPACVSGSGTKKQLVVRCECGFEVRGTEEHIVPALQKHAGESRNMNVTREQVLARAHPI
jgi:predicted small metal-binding protein